MGYGKNVHEILYGGDYNPEQWPDEVWREDMRLLKKAHINEVTLNVFSWAALQPDEDTYDFSKLDKIMELVREHGLKVCMATSTGAHPAWMARKYPDILRTEADGRKRKFGGRHNSCPNSPTYRKYAQRLAEKLAERYQDYENIVAWHVSNEYGGACYCENCEKAFRRWLKRKYKTLDEVNRSFNTSFWGHTFYDWEDIVLPSGLSEHIVFDGVEKTMFQGISLDYMRFMSDSILDCFCLEYDAIKKITPEIPITTNLMRLYKELDYFKWAKQMDFISWDNYPQPTSSAAETSFAHDLMRGIGGQNSFVLMEQTPSVTNWHPFNRLKRPGVMRLLSYQAAAHGADAIQFFQIRRSIGACEKYHGAVIDHAGREDTRVFREVTQLGEELSKLGDVFLEGRTPAQTAIVFDWDNWWALEYSAGPSVRMNYLDAVLDYYTACHALNIPVDVIGTEDELSPYKVVIAPLLYMVKSGYDAKIRRFTESGGTFVTTYFSGIVDEHDLVHPGGYPGMIKDILGIWVEEQDALAEGESNAFVYGEAEYPADVLCDIMHLEGAECISSYQRDFYQKTPVITRNFYGKGQAWYVGTRSDKAFYRALIGDIAEEAGVFGIMETPDDVEAAARTTEKGTVVFLLNHKETDETVILNTQYQELLTEKNYSRGSKITLPAKGVAVLVKPEG